MPTPSLVTTLPISGHPVRFYRSPRDVPDFPWFAYVDMLAAAGVPDHGWDAFLDRGRQGWAELTYDLPDGTMLVAMNVGDLLLAWLVEHGWEHVAQLRPAWEDAWSAVFCSLHPGLTGEALSRYIQVATLNCTPTATMWEVGHIH